MSFEVVVPQMGESVLEGTIVEWKIKEGDKVKINQPLVEIMTDKINIEIPAEVDGVVEKILAKPGDVIPVGKLICTIAADGSAPAVKASAPEKPAAMAAKAPQTAAAPVAASGGQNVMMAPAVRKLIREYGLDPSTINGTGPQGRITEDDVRKAALARSAVSSAASAPAAAPRPTAAATAARAEAPSLTSPDLPKYAPSAASADDRTEERVPLAGPRKMIAEHMVKSIRTATHVTTFEDCDFTTLVEYRKKIKDQFQQSYGVSLTYMPFIAKAAVEALKEFPALNASLTETEIIYKKYYNIGMAVGRDSGLIVPVVRNADKKSIIDMALEMNDLGLRARTDKLKLDEVQGGTFTLTNAGMYGATASTPIINQPQVAILGIHKIAEKPVVKGGQIVIRHMSTFGLSFDHRLIDGHTAVQFLHRLIGYLEDPQLLLLRLR